MITESGQADKVIEQAQQAYGQMMSALQPYTPRRTYQRLFTPLVLIWCLIFQRLNPDHSCDAVVSHLRQGDFDAIAPLPHKAALSQRCRSDSSAGYCKARQRIPLAGLVQVLERSLAYARAIPVHGLDWLDRRVFLLDGSTLRVHPQAALVRQYGQHKTNRKVSYWVVIRIVGLFWLQNGILADLREGSFHDSEQHLAEQCLSRLQPGDLCIGDRAFGMFRIAQAVRQAHGEVLLRLSGRRARKLFAGQFYPGYDLAVVWTPSPKDTLNAGMARDPIPGRLIYVRLERPGFRSQDVYLFTTLLDRTRFTRDRLLQLYGLRWHVELNLRYVKRTLDLHCLAGKSVEMIRKELLAGAIAYNLVRLCMLLSATAQGLSPLRLSFARCLRRVFQWLRVAWAQAPLPAGAFQRLLQRLAQCLLPRRPAPRLEPRWVRPRDKTFPEFWVARPQARRTYSLRRSTAAIW